MTSQYRYQRKLKMILGSHGESMPYDFTDLGWDAKELTDLIHSFAYDELVKRPLAEVCEWSYRTQAMLDRNKLTKVGHVLNIKLARIHDLIGCGFSVRKEVYEAFGSVLNIELVEWHPNQYWNKFNFNTEEDD